MRPLYEKRLVPSGIRPLPCEFDDFQSLALSKGDGGARFHVRSATRKGRRYSGRIGTDKGAYSHRNLTQLTP